MMKKITSIALITLMNYTYAAPTTLTVYTAFEADQLKAYQQGFEKQHPDIKLNFVRDSNGIITAKILAEGENTKADIIYGVAASNMVQFKNKGLLQPYAPHDLKQLNPKFLDTETPPSWVGMNVWGAAICFNTIEAKKNNLPMPKRWKDLENPLYKGKIVMPNPASSGTGYFDVTAWLGMMGDDAGWKFMDGLHQNIAQYTHSGSKPCKQAATGEFPIGISFEYRAAKTKSDGAPIEIIFPSEGLGWDLESIAMTKNAPHPQAAQQFIDWATSQDAFQLYAKNVAIVAHEKIKPKHDNIPENYANLLVTQDFNQMAAQREAILKEWLKRYGSKSEKQ